MNPPKEKKEQTTIRLPADLKEELMKIKSKFKINLNSIITNHLYNFIQDYLESGRCHLV
jgi:hypothetical protein